VDCNVQVADLYDPKEQWASYVINAVKAKEFQTKDVNYIVRKGEVRCLPYPPTPLLPRRDQKKVNFTGFRPAKIPSLNQSRN
jgi:hypothetical protein